MNFTFRNDQPDVFLTIVREVGQWLTNEGRELWVVDTLTAQNLINDETRGNLWVMYVDQTPAATFILQWEDALYWPDVPPDQSGFIHKLAIRRAFAGQNLFQPILDFCKVECRQRSIHEIQLETDATRPALMRFYERNEFQPTHQRTIHEFGQTFRCQYYKLIF